MPESWTEGGGTFTNVLAIWYRGGWVGVDLFFVLSGFLVSGLLFREHRSHGDIEPGRFLLRRAFKLYPAFWVFLAVSVVVEAMRGTRPTMVQIIAELLFVQNYVEGVWLHTWTLAVEEHFYLLLTLFVMFCIERNPGRQDVFGRIPRTVLALGLSCLALRLASLIHGFSYRLDFFPSHLRLDALAFGVLLGYLQHRHGAQFVVACKRHRLHLVAGAVFGFLPAFLIPLGTGWWLQTFGLTGIFLGAGALLCASSTLDLPDTWWVRLPAWIGSYSYSIYLWHVAVVDWVVGAEGSLLGNRLGLLGGLAAYLLAALGVGILLGKVVEFPFLQWRDRVLPSRGTMLRPSAIPES